MIGFCSPLNGHPLAHSIQSRRQFRIRSASNPPAENCSKIMTAFTRPQAFTTGALEGFQRDWTCSVENKRQQTMSRQKQFSVPRKSFDSTTRSHPNIMPKTLAASNIPGLPIASSLQAEQSLRQFLRLYDDNKFPIRLVESSSQRADRRKLQWLVGLGDLSAAERRQLIHGFANGLPVEKQPYSLVALQALKDLMAMPNGAQEVADCLPVLIPQLRLALNSSQVWKKLEALELLRDVAQMPGVGPRLVPYFRMLLPPLRIGMVRRANTDIPACQREKLVNAIDRTLLTLEQKGGPKAAINIKQIIPEFQSFYSGSFD